MDELKGKLIANLQGYLRERQDFVASIPTMDPIWSAPFDIIGNIFKPFLGGLNEKGEDIENIENPTSCVLRCPNLFLLLDNIVRSENIRAGAIQFVIKIIKQDDTAEWNSKFEFINNNVVYKFEKVNGQDIDSKVAIYLGTSGCQAFYSIIENFLRNITRHSNKSFLKKVVEYSNKIIKKENPNVNDATPLIIAIEFHINDDENGKKEDYILTKIYCNSYEWEKINDRIWVIKDEKEKLRYVVLNENISEEDAIKELLSKFSDEQDLRAKIFNRKFNPETPEGKIIDETGKVIEGNWGLKEMRICASFLRGLKITDYETPLPKDEPPVLVPYVQPYEKDNNKGSLGYKFYLPKVKDLLIISKDIASDGEIKVSDLKEQGIYIESDINKITEFQSRGKFTHEFVVIDVDENNNVDFLKKNILKLPYKLFFTTKNGNLPDDVVTTIKKIRWDLSNGDGDINNLKYLIINKNELSQWLKKDNQSFEINGDTYNNFKSYEKTILEIRKRWIEYIKGKNEKVKLCFYYVRQREGFKEWDDNISCCLCSTSPNYNCASDNILFDHKWEHFEQFIINNPLFVTAFTHGVSNPITKIKEEIEKIRGQSECYNYNSLRLVTDAFELAYSNVIIIDERIYDEAQKSKNIFKELNIGYYWKLQNVRICNLEGEGATFRLKVLNFPQNMLNQSAKEEVIEIKEKSMSLEQRFDELFINFKDRLHFLIIHQTIIDTKIYGKNNFNRFISIVPESYKPWYLIITSGRGHPSEKDMPENSKFLEFSNLRRLIIDVPDKYQLTKLLSGLKEREK